jgi:hypothetical protein
MIIIIQRKTRQEKPVIDFVRCLLKNESTTKEVWLPPWECIKGLVADLRDKDGNVSYWMIEEVYF